MKGQPKPELRVFGLELDESSHFGSSPVGLASGGVVIGERLVKRDRVRRILELLASALDELRPSRGRQNPHRRGSAVLRVERGETLPQNERVRTRRTASRSARLIGLTLPLVLRHQIDQRAALSAGLRRRPAKQGFGQLVQAKLVHLAGEPDLRLGIEPESEKPFGGVPCPLGVPGR